MLMSRPQEMDWLFWSLLLTVNVHLVCKNVGFVLGALPGCKKDVL